MERVARNQGVFRDANERIEQSAIALGLNGETPFICECGDERCSQAIRLTREEYELVRTHSTRFVIVPGHEIADAEWVVEQNDRFAIVEKTGVGREIAEADDRRAQPGSRTEPE